MDGRERYTGVQIRSRGGKMSELIIVGEGKEGIRGIDYIGIANLAL